MPDCLSLCFLLNLGLCLSLRRWHSVDFRLLEKNVVCLARLQRKKKNRKKRNKRLQFYFIPEFLGRKKVCPYKEEGSLPLKKQLKMEDFFELISKQNRVSCLKTDHHVEDKENCLTGLLPTKESQVNAKKKPPYIYLYLSFSSYSNKSF